MTMNAIVAHDVANADSVTDNFDGCRRSVVNAVNSAISEEIDVPIICLDDDDLDIDHEYKLFFDRLTGGHNSLPLFEDDKAESETRTFDMSCGGSKRSTLGNEKKPINNRVPQQRNMKTIGFQAEISRAFPLASTRESIQRDNRVAERRRKRKIAEFEAARVSSAVPFVRNQENIQPDSKSRRMSESKVETLRDVPLVRTQEVIQRDNQVRKFLQLNVETLRATPLARTQEDIQRDNKAKKMSESKVGTLGATPSVRTEENIQRDNIIAEQRKKKIDETKAAGTSRSVPVERINRAAELKAVDETSRSVPVERINRAAELKAVDGTSRDVPVTQSNKGVFGGARKNNDEQSVEVVDKDYRRYLTWLVGSLKDSAAEPCPSDSNPPISETQKASTIVPEKDVMVDVKVELDLESLSDDDDIIAVSDSPFLDGEGTPFVVSKSKSVIDLEKESGEDESSCCRFKKGLMDALEKPYDEEELVTLWRRASVKKPMTRCRELRKGRQSSYETEELGRSYFEMFSDFDKEYKRVDGGDKARLRLLRGFFFYLENVSLSGAFQPWLPENKKRLGQKGRP